MRISSESHCLLLRLRLNNICKKCYKLNCQRSRVADRCKYNGDDLYLVYDSSEEESDLHEHEVGGGVEVLETDEGEIVVEAVETGRDEIERQD